MFREKIDNISIQLKEVHKRLLDDEKQLVEKTLGKKISPVEFYHMLTQDKNFVWQKPFTALIIEIDTFVDDAETVVEADYDRIKKQVEDFLKKTDSAVDLFSRFEYHLKHDPHFAVLNTRLKKSLASDSM